MAKRKSRTRPSTRSSSSSSSGESPQAQRPVSTAQYVTLPTVSTDTQRRLDVVIEVVSGRMTVTEGAAVLNMSRVHFQTLRNIALRGMAEALEPKPKGRPKVDRTQQRLERRVSDLEEEVASLERQLENSEMVIGNLTDMLRERTEQARKQARSRSRKTAKKSGKGSKNDDAKERLSKARALCRRGLSTRQAARAIAVSPSTLRRWWSRNTSNHSLVSRPGPGPKRGPSEAKRTQVADLVRASDGTIGADALRRTVGGVSRRQAAAIKATTRTEIERERKTSARQVVITKAGVVRGFDAMHVRTRTGKGYLLAASDGAVPFRTTAKYVQRYDEKAVLRVLERDFAAHGLPLVLRMDRAKQHRTPSIEDLLGRHDVVCLHGPPHHPQYYGQLERHNGDHRRWLGRTNELRVSELERRVSAVNHALNDRVPRRSLGWQTPRVAWNARIHISRTERFDFREAVEQRAQRLLREATSSITTDVATRFAIEIELKRRGYLIDTPGGQR